MFFGKLEAVLDDVADRDILLLGDFNAMNASAGMPLIPTEMP